MKSYYLGKPFTTSQKKMIRDVYREENRDEINSKLREYRRRNPEKIKIQHRKHYYAHRYKITLERAEQLLNKQGNICAICRNSIMLGGKGGAKVDHCHTNNEIRGILCSNCNIGLGQFKEDITILSNAISYLNSFRENKSNEESKIGVAG